MAIEDSLGRDRPGELSDRDLSDSFSTAAPSASYQRIFEENAQDRRVRAATGGFAVSLLTGSIVYALTSIAARSWDSPAAIAAGAASAAAGIGVTVWQYVRDRGSAQNRPGYDRS